ncbi:MAG: hypothetical protein ORN58_06445, partial [Sediminibacterium sp.]|nr:hypothetical protein [Sediminibacterium sp.]
MSSSSNSVFSKFERPLHIFVCFAAAIVILGALAKILHHPLADIALKIGLITEALIFIVYGIFPPDGAHKPNQVQNTVSENNVVETMNTMLENAHITPEFLQLLSQNFQKLNSTIQGLQQNTEENANFHNQIQILTQNVSTLNLVFEQEIKNTSKQFSLLNDSYTNINESNKIMISSKPDAQATKEQLNVLANNLTKL